MSSPDTATRDMLAQSHRLIKEAVRASKRARATIEGRERVRETLLKLSPYDPRYARLLSKLEERWQWSQ